eukprot:Pgem_evm1s9130
MPNSNGVIVIFDKIKLHTAYEFHNEKKPYDYEFINVNKFKEKTNDTNTNTNLNFILSSEYVMSMLHPTQKLNGDKGAILFYGNIYTNKEYHKDIWLMAKLFIDDKMITKNSDFLVKSIHPYSSFKKSNMVMWNIADILRLTLDIPKLTRSSRIHVELYIKITYPTSKLIIDTVNVGKIELSRFGSPAAAPLWCNYMPHNVSENIPICNPEQESPQWCSDMNKDVNSLVDNIAVVNYRREQYLLCGIPTPTQKAIKPKKEVSAKVPKVLEVPEVPEVNGIIII